MPAEPKAQLRPVPREHDSAGDLADGDLVQLITDSKRKKTSRVRRNAPARTTDALGPLKERVSELAWTGHHAEAIEQASAALAKSGLSVESRLDLLDLRAESLIAQGDLDRASADADAMLDFARAAGTPALNAQAHNRLAAVQMRSGALK